MTPLVDGKELVKKAVVEGRRLHEGESCRRSFAKMARLARTGSNPGPTTKGEIRRKTPQP